MATFIERCPTSPAPDGRPQLRVAIKDLIDMVGLPTTAGSRAVAATALAATEDAACMAGIRAAEARGDVAVVGKVNLHELAFGVTGVNPWYGTPVNPLGRSLIPGGSSSGSAVVVGDGEADVALGSDTGGSIRIPAACCGVAGLKTTHGRISLAGVWPLAPSLDTIGPMARDVAGLIAGMQLLDPSFAAELDALQPGLRTGRDARAAGRGGDLDTAHGPVGGPTTSIGRFRLPAAEHVDAAIDAALHAAELDVVDVNLPGWAAADAATTVVLGAEAWASDGHLADAGLSDSVLARLRPGAAVTAEQLAGARHIGQQWQAELARVIETTGPVALPTLADDPPTIEDAGRMIQLRYTLPVNLAGFPALTIPVPSPGMPVGLQLIGLPGSEAQLLVLGAAIEAACRR
jgi:amidase